MRRCCVCVLRVLVVLPMARHPETRRISPLVFVVVVVLVVAIVVGVVDLFILLVCCVGFSSLPQSRTKLVVPAVCLLFSFPTDARKTPESRPPKPECRRKLPSTETPTC